MSTPSSPSRKTMIAELVTTVALLAESPRVAAASPSLVSSASRVSRISRRGARLAICLARPSCPRGAEPDQALDVEREAGVEGAQPPLRAELEERVRLQARLLGLAVLAGAGGGLHAIERQPDQVVVGLVGLLRPRLRHRGLQRRLGLRGDLGHLLVRRHARTSAWRRSRRGARARSAARRRRRCAPGRAWRAGRAGRRTRATAPVRNATASVISKSRVTWSPLTPRPYSTGTSERNCSSCWARRAASSGVNGAAVKPSSARVGGVERGRELASALGQRGERRDACSSAAAPRSSA